MPDHRTRRQKLEAVIAANSGATDGERSNARSLLAKMKPESANGPIHIAAKGTIHNRDNDDLRRGRSPLEDLFRAFGRQANSIDMEELIRKYTSTGPPPDPHARAWSNARRSFFTYTWPPEEWSAPETNTANPSDCAKQGHRYVVIGETMLHADIRRCVSCGVFDPAR